MFSVVGLLGALAVSGYGSQVTAQGALQIGGRQANFGVRPVSPGFVPDPVSVNIVSGGNIDARNLGLGPGCVGFVTRQPDYIVRLTGTSSFLRFYVTAGADTTLLVNTASGRWACNDDSFGGVNPSVDLTNAGPGQYDVWVGSYQSGTQARGSLNITELQSNHP
ncbi:MAG: hypothetical protein JNK72_15615 [Myxococcales bacterium]|nr:hypothetical protein [Myxococcales bacterium]